MRATAFILIATILAYGCGGTSTPRTYPVSGTVTWEGQPLGEGDVLFSPAEGAAEPDVGTVRGGSYSIRAKPGKYRVSIRASKLVPGSKGAMGEPIVDNYIPEQYNAQTTLTADVTAGGDNRFDFALTGSPPTKR